VTLATDWGGTADGIEQWGVPIPYKLVPADWRGAKRLEGQALGEWAEPDVMGVAETMRTVARERDIYQRRAYIAAGRVRAMYDWRVFAGQVLEVWNGA
jgi:hypothetical protein